MGIVLIELKWEGCGWQWNDLFSRHQPTRPLTVVVCWWMAFVSSTNMLVCIMFLLSSMYGTTAGDSQAAAEYPKDQLCCCWAHSLTRILINTESAAASWNRVQELFIPETCISVSRIKTNCC
jgi:hypothetical protein